MTVEILLSEANLTAALKNVQKKKKSPGIDKMRTWELSAFWELHREEIIEKIRLGAYKPQPTLAVSIPKNSGNGTRNLEIPCVLDRMIQSAMYTALSPFYEKKFSEKSFGFRNMLGTKNALQTCLTYLNRGLTVIVDLDILKFFDNVDHSLLLAMLEQEIKDPCLLTLIKKYLTTRVVRGHHVYEKYCGLSQGSSLSPLLANIFLDSFDKFLERRGLAFVRYADDIVIFCRSLEEAIKTRSLSEKYLSSHLKLNLNMEKTKIVTPDRLIFLGYAFSQDTDRSYHLTINDEIENKILKRVNKFMQRTMIQNLRSPEQWWKKLGAFHRGLINYYQMADPERMTAFLLEAESMERKWFFNMLSRSPAQKYAQDIMNALYQSEHYSSLSGWYNCRVLTETNDLKERMIFMNDTYHYLHSGLSYRHKQQFHNQYGSLLEQPFYYQEQHRIGLYCQIEPMQKQSECAYSLSETETSILDILSVGKNMTLGQLMSYLLLKGISVEKNELNALLAGLRKQGLISQWNVFQMDNLPWHQPQELRTYQATFRGYSQIRQIYRPSDHSVSSRNTQKNYRRNLYFYTATVLWNQIVLNYLVYGSNIEQFFIETEYTHAQDGKIVIPLWLETDGQKYFFQYMHHSTESALCALFRKWKIFQKLTGQEIIPVIILDSIQQIFALNKHFLEKLAFESALPVNQLYFSTTKSWFMEEPGTLLPFQLLH